MHIAVQTQQIIRAFQVFGHRAATLDPLGIHKPQTVRELDPAVYGLTEQDLDTVVKHLDESNVISGLLSVRPRTPMLAQVLDGRASHGA